MPKGYNTNGKSPKTDFIFRAVSYMLTQHRSLIPLVLYIIIDSIDLKSENIKHAEKLSYE